jgi:restriction system protein
MTGYYRIMPGRRSTCLDECLAGGYIGADFSIHQDLTGLLPDDFRTFNKEFIPVLIANDPAKTKVSAGLNCGMLWTICRGMAVGDVVLAPDGAGEYRIGTVAGPYRYDPNQSLFHQRPVTWRNERISRTDMSEALRRSAGSIGTVSNLSHHAAEIESLLHPQPPALVATDPTVEDVTTFALEKHLEDFLVSNWDATELGKRYKIYRDENGEMVGQQYPSDTGPIDILAISHDGTELLVVELKRGRASDTVVGQIQRYMGFVLQDLAEAHQSVKGMIIALNDDVRIRRALAVAPNISFFRYEVSFRLVP